MSNPQQQQQPTSSLSLSSPPTLSTQPTLPSIPKYPSKPHLLTVGQLSTLNFSTLSPSQQSMLQDLSTFTPHRQFIKMLLHRHSDMKKKQYFIKQNSSLLTSDQFGQFNRAKFQYQNNSRTFAAFFTGFMTMAGLGLGLWVLPARKSPWKYTAVGFGVGVLGSYAVWRMQIFKYHNRMNQQFKMIVKDKYQSQKKRVVQY